MGCNSSYCDRLLRSVITTYVVTVKICTVKYHPLKYSLTGLHLPEREFTLLVDVMASGLSAGAVQKGQHR